MKLVTLVCASILAVSFASNADASNRKSVKACQKMADSLNRENPDKLYTPIPSTAETRFDVYKCDMTVVPRTGNELHVRKGVQKIDGRQFFVQGSDI